MTVRWRLAAASAALVLLCLQRTARAVDAPWAGRRPAILTLIINEVPHGDSLVLLTAEDALIERDDLRRAGVTILGARTETARDRVYVSVRSLGIRFRVDEPGMTIHLTVAADLLATTRVDLGAGGAPAGIVHADQTSAYLSYAVHAGRDVGTAYAAETRAVGFAEVGTRWHGALAQSTVTASADRWPVRGASSVTWDDRDDLRRLIAGDHVHAGGGLGGSAFVGGVHLVRSFELDPYLTTAPALDLRGVVLVPSTAEVYIDGALVQRLELAPGTYDLSNLPAAQGAGNTRVVVRDPLGRVHEVNAGFYLPAGLLRPGLSDYALSLGARREALATESWSYGAPVALGRYRRGLGRRLTAGVRGEASFALASGGAAVSTGSRLGQLELGIAASVDHGRSGGAGSLAWAYLGRRGGGSLSVRALSAHYATLDVGAAADRPSLETRVGANRALGARVGISVQAATALRRDGGWASSASLTAALASPRGYALAATVGGSDDALTGPAVLAMVSLTFGLGQRTRGAISHQQDGRRTHDRVDVHRTLPAGDGVGYRLAAQLGERDLVTGELEAQNRFGRYQVGYLQHETGGRVDVAATGGVATVGGRVFATRSLDRSFVLVRVPDAAGVGVYLDNKTVGRTDERGDLLVIDALPNYGNRIAIEAADLPDDRPPSSTSLLVAPPARGGVVVTFPAPRLQVVRGRLQIERAGRRLVPAFGEISVGAVASLDDPDSEQWTSPLGSDGEFEINGLSSGGYPAVIHWDGGSCELGLDVPVTDRAIVDLGVRVCHLAAPEPGR